MWLRLLFLITVNVFVAKCIESPAAILKSGLDKVGDIFTPVKNIVTNSAGPDNLIDNKYFDDILRIWNHLDFEEATPRAVKPEEVTYYLFTRHNKENFTRINKNDTKPLNPDNPVVFIIHGWTESREKQWYEDLKNAILDSDDVSVIQVDWSGPASDSYAVAVLNTRDVGAIIGDFAVQLHEDKNIPLENITLVGHSLGGQVSGFVGKRVKEVTNSKLGKIVALDPAGPLYSSNTVADITGRLNASDAEVVEVIHTDGGKFGFANPCGTVDFFPNGGSAPQPGCLSLETILSIEKISGALFCSHKRSHSYYIEAVKEGGFTGSKCSSWAKYLTGICSKNEKAAFYGNNTDDVSGKFFLRTNSDYPFAIK